MMKPRKEPCESETKERIRTSLILSTYNNPQVLALCLESIRQQKHLPDEVIVGDDGSTDETRRLLDSLRTDFPVPLIHVWQEDDGFRLAKIRNKVHRLRPIRIHHPDRRRHHPASVVRPRPSGIRRTRPLSERDTAHPRQRAHGRVPQHRPIFHTHAFLARNRSSSECDTLHGSCPLSGPETQKSVSLGANMSYWRSDAIAINGYDEAFPDGEGKTTISRHDC